MRQILKNGSVTFDPRLTRIFEAGTNDKMYSVRKVSPKKPRSYTHRLSTILDQGQEGSCVGHGYGHLLLARPKVYLGIDHTVATYLYWLAQQLDKWGGGAYPGAAPQYEGTSMQAGAKALIKMGYYKEYRHAKTFEEFLLGMSRYPAVLGMSWYEGMLNTDRAGFIRPTGSVKGGHCVLCNSQSLRKEEFVWPNSWGPGWGVNGFAKVAFEDANRLLFEEGGEAIFMIK